MAKMRVTAPFAGLSPNGEVARRDGTILSISGALDAQKVMAVGTDEDRRLLKSLYSTDPATGTLTPFMADVNTLATEIAADSPAGWWRLGEASGNALPTVSAVQGTVTVGTGARATTGLALGDADKSIHLVGGQITFGNNFGFSAGSFVVEFMLNPDTPLVAQNAAQKAVGGTDGWAILTTAAGGVIFRLWAGGVTYSAATAAGVLTAGSPAHIACRFNSNTKDLAVFVNGVGYTTNVPGANVGANTNGLVLGADSTSANRVPGFYDEFAVYSGLLTDERIVAHAVAGLVGP